MLIKKDGSKDNAVIGIVTPEKNIYLTKEQFFQITTTGKRIELWEGDSDYCKRITYWNMSSVVAYIKSTSDDQG